jgi:hypothetical protein
VRPGGKTVAPPVKAPCAIGGDAQQLPACRDDNLRSLEQQLAVFERQSLANGDDRKRDLLLQTRARFAARRAVCTTQPCVEKLVLARTTEIADIMKSSARPPRE